MEESVERKKRHPLKERADVMKALMLRDLRTRFFNHGLGFLVVALWPLCHMAALLALFTFAGRQPPYGDSLNVFFVSGLIPTLLFMYVSRFMSVSLLMNASMLAFPVIKPVDILFSRALLEALAGALTAAFIFLILYALGDDPLPFAVDEAVACYFSILLFSIGIGMIVGTISIYLPIFNTIYALFMIIVYGTSGVMFVTSSLPTAIGDALAYSPVVQAVEWMRSAYFPTYNSRVLDKQYLVFAAMTSIFLGLLVERLTRRMVYE
ncbi:ABC transporter permease [Agrobacterium rosae]|uniref:ABC transporter permease n=1 Tax=Agrobacterium rosae TaxID=1972867 RepID=A0AAW9FTG3_9HYPH|nr:ABC transporter permease [Agrobacterium rosae]MDX8305829.1 ABC transporter permease [Agrobacterium rosae]